MDTFDLVFLDHWKKYYLPDTKLMEASVTLILCRSYSLLLSPMHDGCSLLLLFFPTQECGLLRKGSVLLADNVICPGAPDYLEYVRSSPRYQSRYFKAHLEYTNVEDGLEKSVFLG